MSLYDLSLVWLITNVLAFVTFGFDKIAAHSGWSRVRERTLLLLTLIGGLGAMSASSLFRHKTRKQPFRRYAVMLCALHLILSAALLVTLR